MARYLAVAYQTSESEEFIEAAKGLVAEQPGAELVLLVPATPVQHTGFWTEGESHAVAEEKAEAARMRLVDAGVKVAATWVGDPNPYHAVVDAMNRDEFDGLLISTYSPGLSRWLKFDLVNRIRKTYDVPVLHVIAG